MSPLAAELLCERSPFGADRDCERSPFGTRARSCGGDLLRDFRAFFDELIDDARSDAPSFFFFFSEPPEDLTRSDAPSFFFFFSEPPEEDLGDLYAESGRTLQSSFTAVSKPNFASKYASELARKALAEIYTMHSFAPFLKAQNFA